jgi:phage-related protein
VAQVYEIVSDHDKNAYRVIYIVNLIDAIYVIHAFQKKSKSGIKTPQEHVDLIKDRIKRLKESL